MKCPKCGYVSFDFNLECPKCRSDLSVEQSKLNLPSFRPSPPFLLGAVLGNEDQPIVGHLSEFTGASGDDSAKSTGNAAESIGAEEDTSFVEGVDYEATEEIQAPSDFPSPPPQIRRQIEEIKELISELMPEKSKTEHDEKPDDIMTKRDFSVSRGKRQFGVRDQSPEDELVEGLEDLEIDFERKIWRILQTPERLRRQSLSLGVAKDSQEKLKERYWRLRNKSCQNDTT